LRVLARSGDDRLLDTLRHYLADPTPEVRCQAVALIDDLVAQSRLAPVKQMGLDVLFPLLNDPDISVRMATIEALSHTRRMDISRALLPTLSDHSFEVRRLACTVLDPLPRRELEAALDGSDVYLAECATVILTRRGHLRTLRRVEELMLPLVTE